MQIILSGGPAHGDAFDVPNRHLPPYIDIEDADEDFVVVREGEEARPMPFSKHRYLLSGGDTRGSQRSQMARYLYWRKLPD